MKTDSLLYRIFKAAPAIFFELIGQPNLQGYEFQSVEVKQTAHRIDGVFLPPSTQPDWPIFFAEFQFQEDSQIYHRLFAEIFLYLEQNPSLADWQAVIIYPRRSLEPKQTHLYQVLLDSRHVQRFYLNELNTTQVHPPSMGLLQLIVASKKQAPKLARRLCAESATAPILPAALIIELVITTMVYKYPNLSREEVIQMLEIAESLQQTRFYQDVLEEGRQAGLQEGRQVGLQEGRQVGLQEEGRSLIFRLLNRRVGSITPELRSQIEALTLEQLESLGEALLDFEAIADLQQWLEAHTS